MNSQKSLQNILNFLILFSVLCTTITFSSCYRPPTVKKVAKSPVYSYLPRIIVNEIEPGFKLEVSKCDPDDLNRDTYLASRRISSENEMETQVTIENIDGKNKQDQKSPFDKAFRDIDYLQENGIIDSRLARELKLSYTSGYSDYSDIGTINAPRTVSEIHYPSSDNPYKSNRFTMFRMLMTNENNEIKRMQLSNLIVSSGTEQLNPLSIKYFDTIYSPTSNQYQNILRFNFPNEIQVPPGKSVLKFIAVPMINETNLDLSLTINRTEKITTFNFTRETVFNGGTYNFKYYSINPKTFFTNPVITVVVEFEDQFFVLKNPRQMFFYDQDIAKPITIYCFCEVGREFEFGKIENLLLSKFKGEKINIKLKSYKY